MGKRSAEAEVAAAMADSLREQHFQHVQQLQKEFGVERAKWLVEKTSLEKKVEDEKQSARRWEKLARALLDFVPAGSSLWSTLLPLIAGSAMIGLLMLGRA